MNAFSIMAVLVTIIIIIIGMVLFSKKDKRTDGIILFGVAFILSTSIWFYRKYPFIPDPAVFGFLREKLGF